MQDGDKKQLEIIVKEFGIFSSQYLKEFEIFSNYLNEVKELKELRSRAVVEAIAIRHGRKGRRHQHVA